MNSDARRIAIVGMGPRGFGCLERLAIELARTPARRSVHVSLHDPATHPGAGPIYAPDQPDEMLMNLAVRHVTAWSDDAADLLGGRGKDLLDWLSRHHPLWATGSAYVPRRLVGAYFKACFDVLLDRLPPGLAVTPVRAEVTDLRRDPRGWWVCHADPAFDRRADEVMCTVGHGVRPTGSRSGSFAALEADEAAQVVSPPYPVRRVLTPDRVPSVAVVGVRGFALTFIDMALYLTVGRGGRIDGVEELGTDGAPWPVYTPGHASVTGLVPWSRTGAPLLAKPGSALAAAAADLEEDWVGLRAALRAVGDGTDDADAVTEIVSTLALAAETALVRLGTFVDDRTRAAIATLLDPDPIRAGYQDRHDGPAALAAMRRSVEVALGRRPPDVAWAVGEVWRQGYPGLIDRVGHGGLPERARPRFATLARRLERIGFGAPVENMARLVALVDAGTVDLSHLAGDGLTIDGGRLLLTGPDGSRPVDVVVDSVLPPPGADHCTSMWGALLRRGAVRTGAATTGIEVAPDATCIGVDGRPTPGLAAIGRVTEGWVLGNDTLNRTLHGETAGWARRVVDDLHGAWVESPAAVSVRSDSARRAAVTGRAFAPWRRDASEAAGLEALRRHCVGVVPLPARMEDWQRAVLQDPDLLANWVERHGSPINLHHPAPFVRHVRALQQVATERNVDLQVLFARKADKALLYVDTARDLGIGVDTASEVELTEALARGCDPLSMVCTAAVKGAALLRTCMAAGATIVLDNDDELDLVERLATGTGTTAIVSLRFGGFRHDGNVLPTRFGFDLDEASALVARLRGAADEGRVRVEGVHGHLDGYDVQHRVTAVAQLLRVIDALRADGHPIRHLDIGGGLPMSYIDDADAWAHFQTEHRRALLGERDPITWKNDGYGLHAHDGIIHGALDLYPMHQSPVAPGWLAALLDADLPGHTDRIASALRDRALGLRIEPGRSLLNGCGMTVARVEHRKRHRDGTWSVGLAMNRTQCATAKRDHAVDPLLVPIDSDEPRTGPIQGWLTGAYCTEAELITRRRLRFPSGVARGDLVALPNTAGYLMHFVESRSHRFQLARNLVVNEGWDAVEMDAVDRDHG